MIKSLPMKITLEHKDAKQPTKGSEYSAGYDLYSVEEVKIEPWSRGVIPTGVHVELPLKTYGRVASRSGLSFKHNLEVGAGVIDCDYRGEIKVILRNLSCKPYTIKVGERCAQLIITPYCNVEIEVTKKLNDSVRGVDGFGSTGTH